jgi:hypothetical protein
MLRPLIHIRSVIDANRADRKSMMATTKTSLEKSAWSGRIVSVQPRIRLIRSFDQRHHSYQGYVLCIDGTCVDAIGLFRIAIGKAAQKKYQFRAGMEVKGLAVPVPDPRLEIAGFYKVSGLKVVRNAEDALSASPICQGVPPDLETYRSRGHRRLDARTCDSRCSTCIWGCRMPVEIIVDHWNPSRKRYRFETFCYGPKNCPIYRAGARRKVPGRNGMSYSEEDRIDEEATSHRGPDE